MGVKYQHPCYRNNVNKWERCEIVCEGQEAVHDAGTLFLPRLTDQEESSYLSYKSRTPFYNATWRTIVGLQGMLFRKPPTIEVPDNVLAMMENVTLTGVPMHIFALGLAEECLKVGRVGVFCDYPEVDTEAQTQADASRLNHRPILKMYKAKSIINWKTRTINNATVLAQVVLKEMYDDPIDEFEDKLIDQYRVLDLVEEDGKTIYRVRVIRINTDSVGKETEYVHSLAYPKIGGKNLEAIPFQFIGVDTTECGVSTPPLLDLVDLNIAHYRVSADYEHGCHFTGLPTPIISGHTPDAGAAGKETFYIGSTEAWVFPRSDAKAYFLEFTGAGLGALERNLERKEALMAVLGARMLETQSKKIESADTAAINRGGEQSMLASVAQTISIGITSIMKVFCKFAGASDEKVKFSLNRDFFPIPMDSLMLTAMIAGWQNGAYSYDTLFDNLKKGEIIDPEMTADDEQQKVKDNPPPVTDAPTTTGNVVNQKPVTSPQSAKLAKGGTGKDPTITQLQNNS